MISRVVRIVTRTGSIYIVAQDDQGHWFCQARNVPNPKSTLLEAHMWWPIAPPFPWPPVVGLAMVLMTVPSLSSDDATRMPGGGKLTSAVTDVRWIVQPVSDAN